MDSPEVSAEEHGAYEQMIAQLPRAAAPVDPERYIFFAKSGSYSYMSNYHEMRLWDQSSNQFFTSCEQLV